MCEGYIFACEYDSSKTHETMTSRNVKMQFEYVNMSPTKFQCLCLQSQFLSFEFGDYRVNYDAGLNKF